ncbi:MAG: TonB-dependent receptor [Bryobacteraceae bacterium]|nr:TonB-dependent receptor [Bryobacteraceae bacterium]
MGRAPLPCQAGGRLARADWTVRAVARNRLSLRAETPFSREHVRVIDSPYSEVRGLNAFSLRRGFRAHQTGAYLQSTRNLTSRLNLTFGGRFDNYEYIGRSRSSPRGGLSYRITDKLSWRASCGQYFQQPFLLFLAAFPENRALTPFRADHYVTGFSYVASSTLRFTIEAYRKQYRDYPVCRNSRSFRWLASATRSTCGRFLFPLTNAGRGRAQGIELFVEKKYGQKWLFSRTRHGGLHDFFALVRSTSSASSARSAVTG